jgi:hypothetical protein
MATMSKNPPEAASSSKYEVIFDNTLKAYKKKTGKDLASDPLLCRLETCNSPDSVLALLRQQIPGFDQSRSGGDERLTNWVNPMVHVLCTFTTIIGGAVKSVCIFRFKIIHRRSEPLMSTFQAHPPAGVIFSGIASLLSVGSASIILVFSIDV